MMRGTSIVAIVIITVIMLAVAFILLLLSGKSATADMEAAIMETEPTPTPMPEIVTMEAEEVTCIPFPKPTQTICVYDWDNETLDTFAKGMYGLDSWNEKYGYVLTAVNRYLSGAKDVDGKPLYGSGTLVGIASCRAEYFFYDAENPVTDENRELANFMLNAAFTERFTCNYTGFAFPSTAVLFGYDDERKPIVRTERGGEPFYLNYDWYGVID